MYIKLSNIPSLPKLNAILILLKIFEEKGYKFCNVDYIL